MAKAEKPKRRVQPRTKTKDKVQSDRFVQAARELGVEDTKEFDENFARVVTVKRDK